MVVCVLCLYLTLPWVGLQCVILVFPGHTHLFVNGHNTSIAFVWITVKPNYRVSEKKGYAFIKNVR